MWIKTNERLPIDGQRVLFIADTGEYEYGIVSIAGTYNNQPEIKGVRGATHGFRGWMLACGCCDSSSFNPDDVVAWMPLPEYKDVDTI